MTTGQRADLHRKIAEDLDTQEEWQVTAAVDLLDGGATVPFIDGICCWPPGLAVDS